MKLGILIILLLTSYSQAKTYTAIVDEKENGLSFLAKGFPHAIKINGKGTGPKGTLTLTNENATGTLCLDLKSLETGISLRDKHLKEKYIQVEKNPESCLKLTKVILPRAFFDGTEFKGEALDFEGLLTLKGVEKPVTGKFDLNRKDHTFSAKVQFEIKLPDFNFEIPKFAGVTVAETVNINTEFESTGAETK